MRTFQFLLSLLIIIFSSHLTIAQVVEVFPENPTADDTVTIIFHADQGNMALKDFKENIYAHTGVILGTPDEPSGWRYVQGNWGKADPRMYMNKVDENTYLIRYHIRSFYGFSEEEPFLQLSFVFRNEDGTRVAKDKGEKDIFYPAIKTYPNGYLETVSGKDGMDLGSFKAVIPIENGLQIEGSRLSVYLTHFTDEIIGVSILKNRKQPQEFNIAVVGKPTVWKTRIENKASQPVKIYWADNRYSMEISRSPMRIAFYRGDSLLFKDENGFFQDKTEKIAGTRIYLAGDEHIYGAGSRAVNIDRRGQRLYNYNTASFGYTEGETRLNLSIPYIQSSRRYGLFFDNPRKGYFDIGKTEKNVLEFGVLDSALTYYMIMGDTHEKIIENYTYLTGRQDMPPIWTLGFIQSRFGYKSREEADSVITKTLEAGFPLEAVLLDLYWFGDLEKMGNLSFDYNKFPNPSQMILNWNKKGVKTILITESYFVHTSKHYKELDSLGYFAKLTNGKTAKIPDFWAGPAALLDIFEPKAQQWFWKHYDELWRNHKISGWWCDSGEPENHPKRMMHKIGTAEESHNLYPLYWAKMIDEYHKKNFPADRLFNMSRSGYAGLQRYNVFPWSGDVSRSWGSLRAQTSIMLGAGMCGIGYMHSDLGGFTGGPLDEELYTRWLQFGAFTPVMRAHGSGLPSEPIFYSEKTQKLVKEAIQLRYRLLPYNYTLTWENHTKGLPLARPLYYYFPYDKDLLKTDDEYMWGKNLLIAPVFEKNNKSRNVYLPQGKWFDFHTYNYWWGGGIPIPLPALEDRIPVFVRAGAFLPLSPDINHTSRYDADTLIMNYFPDLSEPESEYTLYTDNGELVDPVQKQLFCLLKFKGFSSPNILEIVIDKEGTFPTMPRQRFLLWGIRNIQTMPYEVRIGKEKLKVIKGKPDANPANAYWDEENKRLVFYMNWIAAPATIRIKGTDLLVK